MPGSNATGLMLALLTALFWGALPLALKHLLSTVDALSIVCLPPGPGAFPADIPATAHRWAAGKKSCWLWPQRA